MRKDVQASEEPDVTFDDVKGVDEAKEELEEAVAFEGAWPVHPPRRQAAQGRAADAHRHGQDARQGRRGRGGRPVLLHVRLRV